MISSSASYTDTLEGLFEKIKKNIDILSNEESSNIEDSFILDTNKMIENCALVIDKEGIFSPNEEVDDISTSSLKYLLLDFYMGKSHLQFKEQTGRKFHLLDGQSRFERFIKTCNRLKIISDSDVDALTEEDGPVNSASLAAKRDRKIANYKQEKLAKERIKHLEYLVSQSAEGLDCEEELRELRMLQLQFHVKECMSEMEMIETELTMLQLKDSMQGTSYGSIGRMSSSGGSSDSRGPPAPDPNRKGIEITILSKVDGEIVETRDTVKAGVFKIDKKMTVEQYGDQVLQDYNDAQTQKANSANEEIAIKRYSKLEDDGEEDHHDLVNKATVADREWDAWKEDNPRGWGNKAGKRF
jgi:immunoglobulin-binding protein 1